MIRCILFDVDDTLMDYHEAETAIFRRLFYTQLRLLPNKGQKHNRRK